MKRRWRRTEIEQRTETTGFEPVVRFDPYTDLANRRYRPLSHVSRAMVPIEQCDKNAR